MVELNNYLEQFPTAFNAAQKIYDDEIVDILEFGTPSKWQSEMVHLGFDSAPTVKRWSRFVSDWSLTRI